jgi:uncharacterized protein (TIGR02145 family)
MKPLTILTAILFFAYGAFAQPNTVKDSDGNSYTVKKMPDGKVWMTENLKIKIPGSYCYENNDANCAQYGRLYTWKLAQEVCRSLGDGWRLPSNEDWQLLGKQYGGIRGDSSDGKAAYTALLPGGKSGFNVQLAGGRNVDSIPGYARKDAHGFYWTSTSVDAGHAWMYNFGDGAKFMNRHSDSEKGRAFAVRCVKD